MFTISAPFNAPIVQSEEQQSSKLYAIEGIGCGFESRWACQILNNCCYEKTKLTTPLSLPICVLGVIRVGAF